MAKGSAKSAKKTTAKKSVHPLKREIHPLTSLTVVFWGLILILFIALFANGTISLS